MATWFETFPQIETARLLLRQPVIADAPAFYEILSDEEAMHFISFGVLPSVEHAQALIEARGQEYTSQESLWWTVCRQEDPATPIGTFGYVETNNSHHYAEIGYILSKAHWRHGYTEEGVRAMIHFAFTQMALNRIEARVMVGNEKSMGLLQKLGFTLEGVLRERRFAQGRFYNFNMLSLLKSDYALWADNDRAGGTVK